MNPYRFTSLLIVIVAMGGCEKQSQSTPPPLASAPSTVVSGPVPPRYQIVFSPHLRADTFLLDTQKGRVWVMAKFSDIAGQPSAFDEVDVIDNTGEIGMKFSEFLQLHKSAQASERKGKKSSRTFTLEEAYAPGKSPESKGGKK